jgi:TetR/AcrR family transcriptional repressor of nem operon
MARTKEFDPEAALRAALDLFWERGYEATSITDLVEHLGVARASIYATFGGKHQLYCQALDRYLELRDPVGLLSRPGPALPLVRAFVRSYADESAADGRRRGCFVANSAVELARDDRDVARRVEASWATVEAALETALVRARAQGELDSAADPRGLARLLLVFLQGVKVIAKASPDSPRLQEATSQALRVLG